MAILFSCNSKEGSVSQQRKFTFNIKGNVQNGDGHVISLYIPSQGLDNRIKSVIKNGQYHFEGEAAYIEQAFILFEENIVNESTMYSQATVFIEPDEMKINFKVSGDSMLHFLDSIDVKESQNNKFYYETQAAFWNAMNAMIFVDDESIDSMHQYVYPKVRANTFRVYDSLYASNLYPAVSLHFLRQMIDNNFNSVFRFDKLEDKEKKKLVAYYNNIDPSLFNSPDYLAVKSNIDKINNPKQEISFTDYSLLDPNGNEVKLSDVLEQNNIVVLDFWWSGCKPCRMFNQETTSIYDSLRAHGIEIIAINIDASKQRWLSSSDKDGIRWINLYAGASTDITMNYNIKAYPAKLVFDKQRNLIDFKFNDAKELLSLVKNKAVDN